MCQLEFAKNQQPDNLMCFINQSMGIWTIPPNTEDNQSGTLLQADDFSVTQPI